MRQIGNNKVLDWGCWHEDWKKVLNIKCWEAIWEISFLYSLTYLFLVFKGLVYKPLRFFYFILFQLLLSLSLWIKHWEITLCAFIQLKSDVFQKRNFAKGLRKKQMGKKEKACKHTPMCLKTPSDKDSIGFC